MALFDLYDFQNMDIYDLYYWFLKVYNIYIQQIKSNLVALCLHIVVVGIDLILLGSMGLDHSVTNVIICVSIYIKIRLNRILKMQNVSLGIDEYCNKKFKSSK